LFDGYLNKWLFVEGQLSNMSVADAKSGEIIVTLTKGAGWAKVSVVLLWFSDKAEIERASVLQLGQTVRAIGVIRSADRSTVVLESCELERDSNIPRPRIEGF
jgi:hypothetical protein